MNDDALNALRAAFKADAKNTRLLMTLVNEYLQRGDAAAAYDLIRRQVVLELESTADQCLAARACLEAGHADEALVLCAGESPEALLMQARVCAHLGRFSEAGRLYEKAVQQAPALEDGGLLAAIRGEVRPRSRGQVRSVASDDTSESEMTRMLIPETDRVTFADVGGLDGIKKQITRKIILPFQKPGVFARFRKKAGGGILLYGPPGCGKTLLARATAGECNARFLNVSIADVLDMYVGESEHRLHALFEQARRLAPSVLFFDEIEALGGKRQFAREITTSKLVSLFLSEMDGFQQGNQGVLVLGATNVPWSVDPAFRRPGRFDRVLFVPPPDREARRRILGLLVEQRPTAGDLGLDDLAGRTSGFSGADLRNLIETAVDEAIEESLSGEVEVPLRREHLAAAAGDVRPTTVEWLTTARNYARYANESGQYDEVLEFLKEHGRK